MPQDHPQTAITIRMEEANSPEPMAHITKERSVLQGLRFTRPQVSRARKETELDKPGIYFLWAKSLDLVDHEGDAAVTTGGALPTSTLHLYVGSSDHPSQRFIDHSASAATFPDWTDAFVVSTANVDLDATQANYVEIGLIEKAAALQSVNDFYLVNVQGKKKAEAGEALRRPSLGEGQRAEAEYFLREILLILPLVGIEAFREPGIEPSQEGLVEAASEQSSPPKNLSLRPQGTEAKGEQRDNGFLVYKGSRGRSAVAPSFKPPMAASLLREKLLGQGVLKAEGDSVVLQEDYLFDSPSSAASVLAGSSRSGTLEWRDDDGVTLGEILDSP